MDKEQLEDLIKRYLADTCTQEERERIERWYQSLTQSEIPLPTQQEMEQDLRATYVSIRQVALPPIKKIYWKPIATAASILLFLSLSLFTWFYLQPDNKAATFDTSIKQDLDPGREIAVLRLADGSVVELNTGKQQTVTNEAGEPVATSAKGIVTFASESKSDEGVNNVSIPRGGQFRILLADGTKVWLNAASSLTFPSSFNDKERVVELSGEAYFDVAENSKKPFLVKTDRQLIHVLGTEFNISSYPGETTKTTLASGRVKVSSVNSISSVVLFPGEEAQDINGKLRVEKADMASVLAWKEGLFHFNGTTIKDVMQQFSRWYDVDVVYRGKAPDVKIWGEAFRNRNARQALDILTYFDVKYDIVNQNETKKIIIENQ